MNIKLISGPYKSILEKYLKITGLDHDIEFYRGIDQIQADIEFYKGFINRVGSKSSFSYDVRLSLGGIHQGFLHLINNEFNYYDYDLLKEFLYVFEILRRLFKNYWIEQQGVNENCVQQIKEFHPVVSYYLPDCAEISSYVHHFIGGSYGIEAFKQCLAKQAAEQ